MSLLLDTLVPFVLVYKYWALFLICFTASLALPLPATTSLTAMSVFAGSGYVSLPLTIVVAFLGFVLGDCSGFLLARFYGPKVLKFRGIRRVAGYRYYREAEQYVKRHPVPTIFFSRFVTAAGPVVNVLSGLSSNISFQKFLLIDLIGEALDVALFSLGGYFFGDQFQNYGATLTLVPLAIFIVIFLIYATIRAQYDKKTSQ